jgi:hypothetical protein
MPRNYLAALRLSVMGPCFLGRCPKLNYDTPSVLTPDIVFYCFSRFSQAKSLELPLIGSPPFRDCQYLTGFRYEQEN